MPEGRRSSPTEISNIESRNTTVSFIGYYQCTLHKQGVILQTNSISISAIAKDLQILGLISDANKAKLEKFQASYSRESESFLIEETGPVVLPFHEMGKVNTRHLLGENEFHVFALYFLLKEELKSNTALDLGANLGLHTILLSKLGISVDAFEPDPINFPFLEGNLRLNNCRNVEPHNKAITTEGGIVKFIRVLDNETSSHVVGAEGKNPYGPTDLIDVDSLSLRQVLTQKHFDLVKMDVEGMESQLITSLELKHLIQTKFIIEIGSLQAREKIWNFVEKFRPQVQIYSQKTGWTVSLKLEDLPCNHREGSILISSAMNLRKYT